MNAQQLQLADGSKINAWQCSLCKTIWPERESDRSARCCLCGDCGKQIDPKVDGTHAKLCKACWGPHYAKLDADRMERATELADYDGPVTIGSKYWQTVSDLLDEKDGEELPEFVHTCHVRNYAIDLDGALANLLENASVEDHSQTDFDGVKELQAAVDKFNDANRGLEYWEEDSKHKVRVKPVSSVA